MATKAGPQMKRVRLDDGTTVLLPVGAVLVAVRKPDTPLTEDELRKTTLGGHFK